MSYAPGMGVPVNGGIDPNEKDLMSVLRPRHPDCPVTGCSVCRTDWPCAKLAAVVEMTEPSNATELTGRGSEAPEGPR